MAPRTPARRRPATPADVRNLELYATDISMALGDEVVAFDATAAPRTYNLMDSGDVPAGTVITIVRIGTDQVLIQPVAADAVEGGAPGVAYDMSTDDLAVVVFTTDGAGTWFLLSALSNLQQTLGALNSKLIFYSNQFSNQVGNDRTFNLQLVNVANRDITEECDFEVELWDDANFNTASVNAVVAAATVGTILAGAGTNDAVVKTDVNGAMTLTITDAVGGATHWISVTPLRPNLANGPFVFANSGVDTAAWV